MQLPESQIDGRRARAGVSRRRIADAMLALAREGELDPSADLVAERAGVGRRTVFRLFDDMEGLYREMHAIMTARLSPIVEGPLEGSTWRTRLDALIERRARVFEDMLPIKSAADLQRHRSPFLQREHAKVCARLREILLRVLPKTVVRNETLVEALDLSMSFEAWRRLRYEQKLSVKQATTVLKEIAARLIP